MSSNFKFKKSNLDRTTNFKIRLLQILVINLVCASLAHAYIDKSTPAFSRDEFLQLFTANLNVTQLDQVPRLLPDEFIINFTLKHGTLRKGVNGHLVETKVSQSSDPNAPRAILWDERSGFSISYNSGLASQTANQRIDLLSFDDQKKTFLLQQLDFPIQAGHPQLKTTDCATCHGERHRPIFSMYPDWPSFYGSENDELTNLKSEVQKIEQRDYLKFLKDVVPVNSRYTPLFSNDRMKDLLGVKLYPTFPYRPNTDTTITATSRAFAFRASLRFGILMNRLMAESAAELIKNHPNYNKFSNYFAFNLLQCKWSSKEALIKSAWLTQVENAIGAKAKLVSNDTVLNYKQLLKIFDLKVNDIDIRYSYNHEGYKNEDATNKVMEVGYIGRFWNSYFDGSATIDELVAYQIMKDIQKKEGLNVDLNENGLTEKYQHLAERFKFDENFFREMDKKSLWIPIPYPDKLTAVHHREGFKQYAKKHNELCSALEKRLK